jgi:hypothetical protein
LKRDAEPIYKENKKICCAKSRERKSEFDGCECKVQTMDHQSNVDESCASADNKIKFDEFNCRQSQVTECKQCLNHGIACLGLEIDPQFSDEEFSGFQLPRDVKQQYNLTLFDYKKRFYQHIQTQLFITEILMSMSIGSQNLRLIMMATFTPSRCKFNLWTL